MKVIQGIFNGMQNCKQKSTPEMSSAHGIAPFSFEPVYEDGEELSDTGSSSSEDEVMEKSLRVQSTRGRSSQSPHEWCRCMRCSPVHLTDAECVCCTEWTILDSRLGQELGCISAHPDLDVLCLNRVVLVSMWPYVMAFKGISGPIPCELTNRQYRLTAYRQFIHWANQGRKMGRGVRVVLPSCIVQMIRKAFPEEDPTHYRGFKELSEVDELLERDF